MIEVNAAIELTKMNLIGSKPEEKEDHIIACHEAMRNMVEAFRRELAAMTAADLVAEHNDYLRMAEYINDHVHAFLDDDTVELMSFDEWSHSEAAKGIAWCAMQPSPYYCGSRMDNGRCGAAPVQDRAACEHMVKEGGKG